MIDAKWNKKSRLLHFASTFATQNVIKKSKCNNYYIITKRAATEQIKRWLFSHDRRFSTMWYVRPAKPQISLRIRAVWSEPLLASWIFYGCWATDWRSFGVFKLKRRLHRLVWVYNCQNATLLEIKCRGSFVIWECSMFEIQHSFGSQIILPVILSCADTEGVVAGGPDTGCMILVAPGYVSTLAPTLKWTSLSSIL